MTNAKKILGLLGRAVDYSYSPLIHNTACELLELPYYYTIFNITDPNLIGDALHGAKALGIAGFNVTIPYKKSVVPFLDELSAEASMIGAVNTIVIRDGTMTGHNTDIEGFATPLQPYASLIKGKRVCIFGNGGAALAAIEAFRRFFSPDEILLYVRDQNKATVMLESYRHREIVTICNQNMIDDRFRSCSVVVNATPIGTKGRNNDPIKSIVPLDRELIHKGQIVYDMVYNPLDTPLLHSAERIGATTISGIEMLIGQAALSFALWTGIAMPVGAVKSAVMRVIRQNLNV
jgi:shikimate dehydrogenase